ncbi:hypothetical protein K432DRAFT_385628 [Lepidopterella palustris CBS 459.81]|uniref:Methyltransferase n=1 Tax=Lepidopterella palustris CBS 459.81 TaxID=1314670 RepID=A0A8E2JB81_9PEZI|nr:hypothetical protein K432DRAFT_385628 [Lepidopterella palustris CBS 459.81]
MDINTVDLPITLASIRCIKPSGLYSIKKPYQYSGVLPPSEEHLRSNVEYTTHENVPMHNLRGLPSEIKVNLEEHGFALHKLPFTADSTALKTDATALQTYLTDLAAWTKTHFNAEKVLWYNYRFRRSDQKQNIADQETEMGSAELPNGPASVAHIDITLKGGPKRIRRHLTKAEAEKYLGGKYRLRIVNAWKPLSPVHDNPLALCDRRTISPSDLITVNRVSDAGSREFYYTIYQPQQKWYWLSTQQPDETLFFLNYDSKPPNGACACPHTSFKDPGAGKVEPRESIEVRMIVISES